MKCSFCGVDESRALVLIKQDDVQICEHCVMTCLQIVNEQIHKKTEALGSMIERFERVRDYQREVGE